MTFDLSGLGSLGLRAVQEMRSCTSTAYEPFRTGGAIARAAKHNVDPNRCHR